MSLGGSTVGRSVNCELGCAGTAEISMNDTAVRDLASVPSGEISMDDFYGATALPSTFGQFYEGGYYMGTINAASCSYYLIMAPNATGCACCEFKGNKTNSGIGDEKCNGYQNTYTHMCDSTHPAGNWTRTRTIDGFSDWYLPAICELQQLYNQKSCAPAGEGFAGSVYQSSTPEESTAVCLINFFNGSLCVNCKDNRYRLRATRRIPF
jgi:hypothetical protein